MTDDTPAAAILARITSVIESDWTGDLFIAVRGRKAALILYAGDPDDADLWYAVRDLVASWPCVKNVAESYREWRRS